MGPVLVSVVSGRQVATGTQANRKQAGKETKQDTAVVSVQGNIPTPCSRCFRECIYTYIFLICMIQFILPDGNSIICNDLLQHMFPGLDLYLTDHAQDIATVGQDLDDLDPTTVGQDLDGLYRTTVGQLG